MVRIRQEATFYTKGQLTPYSNYQAKVKNYSMKVVVKTNNMV
ncbi:hypothetical protein BLGI_5014 [Brevibacillus laterosporus GI-9]|nr:hypothetical protein BLGI_5014 [Brevibacillus laterosporus GI-9]